MSIRSSPHLSLAVFWQRHNRIMVGTGLLESLLLRPVAEVSKRKILWIRKVCRHQNICRGTTMNMTTHLPRTLLRGTMMNNTVQSKAKNDILRWMTAITMLITSSPHRPLVVFWHQQHRVKASILTNKRVRSAKDIYMTVDVAIVDTLELTKRGFLIIITSSQQTFCIKTTIMMTTQLWRTLLRSPMIFNTVKRQLNTSLKCLATLFNFTIEKHFIIQYQTKHKIIKSIEWLQNISQAF